MYDPMKRRSSVDARHAELVRHALKFQKMASGGHPVIPGAPNAEGGNAVTEVGSPSKKRKRPYGEGRGAVSTGRDEA